MSDTAYLTFHRASDGETSMAGSDHIGPRLASLKTEFLSALAGECMTAREVASKVSTDHTRIESIRKRASELVRAGSIAVAGKRKCQCTGLLATTYSLADTANEKDRCDIQPSQRS